MRQWLQEMFIRQANAASGLVEGGLDKAAETAQIGKETDLPLLIGNIIDYVLAFVGVILLVMIIYGGFKWMTAGGSEEQVKKARDYIINAVIGLVIVLASFVIVNYIMEQWIERFETTL